MSEISDSGLNALGLRRLPLLADKFMNKDNERGVIRSDIWEKIFSTLSKLNLAESSGDNYDRNSIVTEIEIILSEYSAQREQQQAITFSDFILMSGYVKCGNELFYVNSNSPTYPDDVYKSSEQLYVLFKAWQEKEEGK